MELKPKTINSIVRSTIKTTSSNTNVIKNSISNKKIKTYGPFNFEIQTKEKILLAMDLKTLPEKEQKLMLYNYEEHYPPINKPKKG